MAQILKGAPVVAAMNEANAARCAALKEKGIVPTLAVVRVGAREDDISYEKGIVTRCGKVGVEVRQFHLAEDVTQEELLDVIRQINGDASVHGCLFFRPLPKRFDDRRVQEVLAPEKDVDGITDGSMAGVFTNMPIGYPPCTAQACLEILKHYNVPLSGKRAVVVGRSLVVGKPAAMMLDRENATVTLCNSRTRNLPEVCRQADIVVVAMGKMAAVGADCLRAGQTVVDVGIHVNEEGKLCGDVQFDAAEPVVDAITPVPGGVGTVTTYGNGTGIAFSLKIETMTKAEMESQMAAGTYDIALYPMEAASQSPVTFLSNLLSTNYMKLQSDKIEQALTVAKNATAGTATAACRACEQALTQTGAVLPVFYEAAYYVMAGGVSGVQFHPGSGRVSFVEARRAL